MLLCVMFVELTRKLFSNLIVNGIDISIYVSMVIPTFEGNFDSPYLKQWRSQTRAHPGLGPGVSIRKTVEHRTFVVSESW